MRAGAERKASADRAVSRRCAWHCIHLLRRNCNRTVPARVEGLTRPPQPWLLWRRRQAIWQNTRLEDKLLKGTIMAGIEIVSVEKKADLKDFIDLPWRIYAKHPNWGPPLK